MPALYVVATPIGNLEDVTLRAIRVLKEVKLIAAEDTRKTKRLLDHYGIRTPMTSYYEHNKMTKLGSLLRFLETDDLALVSDAGMPGISDPGYELVVAAARQGVPVVPIPGASAIIAAVAISGLPTDRFTYLGFLPRRKSGRIELLEQVAQEPNTIVAFETPHRLADALGDMLEVLGDRRVAIVREVTKLHEEVFRGIISESIGHFRQPKGEFTIVIEGGTRESKVALTADIEDEIGALQQQGVPARKAIARLSATTGVTRKKLYQSWLAVKNAGQTEGDARV
jgi:16S rRNA (cytidine1402-2'-O)-methyltransferase